MKNIRYFTNRVIRKIEQKFSFYPKTVKNIWNASYSNPFYRRIFFFWSSHVILKKTLPVDLSNDLDEVFIRLQNTSVSDQYIVEIKDAVIKTETGLLRLPSGEYSLEAAHDWQDYIINSPDCTRLTFIHRKVDLPCYSLVGFCPGQYYHFFSDILQSLLLVKDMLPSETHFLCPAEMRDVYVQALGALGIERDRLIIVKSFENVLVSQLFWNPPVTLSYSHHPHLIRNLSQLFLARYIDEPDGDRITLISRDDSSCRRILNERDLVLAVKNKGMHIDVVLLSGSSFSEQIQIFRRSKVIISPHGAGLVNLIFCSPNTCVLELFPSSLHFGAACYWSISECIGLRYFCLKCDSAQADNPNSDFTVPCEIVLNWLSSIA